MGGSQADPANRAFSEGFGLFNFDLMPRAEAEAGGRRRVETGGTVDNIESDPYACDPSVRDSVIVAYLQRFAICFGIVACIFLIRSGCRRLQMWWYISMIAFKFKKNNCTGLRMLLSGSCHNVMACMLSFECGAGALTNLLLLTWRSPAGRY